MDAATRNYIRHAISDIVRERTKPRKGSQFLPLTHEQMVAEIDAAITFHERRLLGGSFPRLCRVPRDAVAAVATP